MSKIRIGDRAIIIKSKSGNEGKIVLVVSYFDPLVMTYEGFSVNKNCTLIIESLGSPLQREAPLPPSMKGPIDPTWLRKLPKIDEPDLNLEYKA